MTMFLFIVAIAAVAFITAGLFGAFFTALFHWLGRCEEASEEAIADRESHREHD